MDRHKQLRVRCSGCGRWFKARSDKVRSGLGRWHSRECYRRSLRAAMKAKG